MMNLRRNLLLILGCAVVLSTGCTTLRKKVNPSREYTTDSGFRFRFPMSGDWYPGTSGSGLFTVAQAPAADGTSKVAMVRHGPIVTPGGKAMSHKELLDTFKVNIEDESKNGRVINVKNHFTPKTYGGADCLAFEQAGEDHSIRGPMNMVNEGLICLHPSRPYRFIWMAMSERWPTGKSGAFTLNADKAAFLGSLAFQD